MARAVLSPRFTGRAWPLVLLLIMVIIGLLLEQILFPPVRIWIKLPILLLLVVGLWARRADPARNRD